MRFWLPALLTLALAGCADWPRLGIDDDAGTPPGYPALVPFDGLTGQAAVTPEDQEADAEATAALSARAAALRARARVLSQPAEDRDALDRMRERLAELGG